MIFRSNKKKVMKILCLAGLALILSFSAIGQIKIAFIDSDRFNDEKTGISELVIANRIIDEEFKPIDDQILVLDNKMKKIIAEIERFKGAEPPKSYELVRKANNLFSEYQKLENEMKKIADEARPQFEKRKIEIVEPVKIRINEKLKEFEKQKGYFKILDLSDDNIANAILYFDNSIDITKEFIKFCNKEFESKNIINL